MLITTQILIFYKKHPLDCGLHNDKYTKFQHCKNFKLRLNPDKLELNIY